MKKKLIFRPCIRPIKAEFLEMELIYFEVFPVSSCDDQQLLQAQESLKIELKLEKCGVKGPTQSAPEERPTSGGKKFTLRAEYWCQTYFSITCLLVC